MRQAGGPVDRDNADAMIGAGAVCWVEIKTRGPDDRLRSLVFSSPDVQRAMHAAQWLLRRAAEDRGVSRDPTAMADLATSRGQPARF